MWWFVRKLGKDSEYREAQKVCDRCGLLYGIHLEACPHCAHISEGKLRKLLDKRKQSRLAMAKIMIIISIFILILLFAYNIN